jgi:hypothetical protein
VKSGPPPLTAEEVAELIRNPEKGGDKIAIIDVRRNDHDVSATWIYLFRILFQIQRFFISVSYCVEIHIN